MNDSTDEILVGPIRGGSRSIILENRRRNKQQGTYGNAPDECTGADKTRAFFFCSPWFCFGFRILNAPPRWETKKKKKEKKNQMQKRSPRPDELEVTEILLLLLLELEFPESGIALELHWNSSQVQNPDQDSVFSPVLLELLEILSSAWSWSSMIRKCRCWEFESA